MEAFSHVVQVGDPQLRSKSQEVPPDKIRSESVQRLISHMKTVMEKYDNVGISAVQVGIPLRIFVMQLTKKQLSMWPEEEARKMGIEPVSFTPVINPQIKVLNDTQITARETCSSVNGFSGLVRRNKEVRINCLDGNGNDSEMRVADWTARIVQHEFDHLEGQLYTDIMLPKSLSFSYWETVNKRNGDFRLGYSGISGISHRLFPFNMLK